MTDDASILSMKSVSLADLAKSFTGRDRKFNYFHGKIYSLIPPSVDQALNFMNGIRLVADAAPNRHPVQILVGDFSTLIKQSITRVLAMKDDKFVAFHEIGDRKLPSCPYLAIIAPAHKVNGSTGYAEANQAIAFVLAFFMLSFGKLLSYEWVANFDFDLDGQISFSGEFIRMPLYSDFFRVIDQNFSNEIIERLSKQQDYFRDQFQTACNFVSSALNQKDEAFRFSSYWIALEVLSRGGSGAIRAKLARAYGNAATSFVDKNLRFSEISKIRHDLLHKGQFKTLKSYQERLLQLYFWDIIADQINLPAHGLALALVQSGIIEEEIRGMSAA